MRPTDVCHPIELRAPAPRVFLARCRHFRGAEAPRRLRLRAATTRGPDVFTTPEDRFGGSSYQCDASNSIASRPGERTWAFSSHGTAAIEPLTSLSRPSCLPHGSRLREMHRRNRRPPRPLPSPTRESLRCTSTRDAFRQQGLFIGFGGHYSPDPATTSPLLAMGEPLDDDLSSP
jgi:hypothetical protein